MIVANRCVSLFALLLGLLIGVLLSSSTVAADQRAVIPPGENNYVPHDGPRVISVQAISDPIQLVQCLIGPDVTISNVTLVAAQGASGVFAGGTGIIGFDSGIVLSSGSIVTLVGPNLLDDVSFNNGFVGDPDLDNLIPGYFTYDATILEFDFECANPVALSFQYVFSSDEYNEWVNSEYNDVFAFFLNGNLAANNIAMVPGGCATPGIPVAINNVDCNNPYAPPSGVNCGCYRNNDLDDGGGLIDTEMDGLTQVFFTNGVTVPGVNHIKIAIADAGDHIYDSNVMIRCQPLSCAPPPETGACCFPNGSCFLLEPTDCVDQGGSVYGGACLPNPCTPPTPAEGASWGRIKSLYR